MKICRNCGNQYDDNLISCPVCGALYNSDNQYPDPQFTQNSQYQGYNQPPQKKNNGVIIAGIIAGTVVVLAIIIAVAATLIYTNNSAEENTTSITEYTTEATTQATTESTTKATTKEKTTIVQNNVYNNYYYDVYGNHPYYEDYDYDYCYGDWEYLFPSDTQLLTTEFLDSKDNSEIDYIRNEIYARHGYIFKKEKYRNYFSQKAWYNPNETSMEKVEKRFNDIERKNIAILVKYQNL